MKQFLSPIFQVESVFDIVSIFENQQKPRAIFIDVDNTLFLPNYAITFEQAKRVEVLLHTIKNQGIEIVAISNNFRQDRKQFFEELSIPFVYFAKKPLSIGFNQAYKYLQDKNIQKNEVIHIGDQLLTDGIGAKLFGIEYILIEPINRKDDLVFALPSRILEKVLGIKKWRRDEW